MSEKIKIAFTSCTRYQAFPKQPQWRDIEDEDPDYLFLLGDQIYMDFGLPIFSKEPIGAPKRYSVDKFRNTMDKHYEAQWSEPHFKKLFEKMHAKNAVHGTWDDHDFAWNNAYGSEVEDAKKNASRELFHKWMNCSTNKPEVYHHIDIPNARVIFLDTRYYADARGKSPRNLLGESQFQFLEEKLQHERMYTIICSGLTLTNGNENWAMFDQDYKRLSSLLNDKKNVLFLAGDIHRNKFSSPGIKRPCYEIVSSGMAVNIFGLPLSFDDRRNWGLIAFDEKEVIVRLTDKRGSQQYVINTTSWLSGSKQLV